MQGHPGGEEHSRYLIELSFLSPPARWLDMGRGTAAPSGCCGHWAMKRRGLIWPSVDRT